MTQQLFKPWLPERQRGKMFFQLSHSFLFNSNHVPSQSLANLNWYLIKLSDEMTLFTYNLIVQVIQAGRGKNSNPLLVQKVLHACTHSLYKYHCYMQVMKDHKNCHGSPPLDLWYPLFSWHTWLFSSERVVWGEKQICY